MPIREETMRTAALATMDEAIHPELYAVVAVVLAYVYKMEQKGCQA